MTPLPSTTTARRTSEQVRTPRREQQRLRKQGLLWLLGLVGGWIALILALESQDADRRFSAWFWDGTEWFLAKDLPWTWVYSYGTIPGLLLTIFAFVAWYACLKRPEWHRWRGYWLVLGLTIVLAAGVIVNGILKEYSGRPRPRQITEFDGPWPYRPVLAAGIPGRGQSFPCGHCTMGFAFVSGVVFWRPFRKFAVGMLVLGLGFGALLSAGRIVQGGHFLSDALTSLTVLLCTLVVLYHFVLPPPLLESRPVKLTRRFGMQVGGGLLVAIAVMVALFLTRRPFYHSHHREHRLPEGVQSLLIQSDLASEHVRIDYANHPEIRVVLEARGFARPDSQHYLDIREVRREDQLALEFQVTTTGYFSELGQTLTLSLPVAFRNKTQLSDQAKIE
ncbi:MAG: phosphatase PAP2 family protein [SAR324 cluster bacterium]|nr:phosphatase PAP2 family protein [SAR324 cluster bacterium]